MSETRLERIVLFTYPEDGYIRCLELGVYAPPPIVPCGYVGPSLGAACNGPVPPQPEPTGEGPPPSSSSFVGDREQAK